MKLNLGAGSRPMEGWLNVDLVAQAGIDVVHDLDSIPWPWADSSAEAIEAYDIFEHVDRPLEFMVECWRILEPRGLLRIHTCHIGSPVDAFTDPTHKRFLTAASFDYWIEGTELRERYGPAYSLGRPDVVFKLLSKSAGGYLDLVLGKLA